MNQLRFRKRNLNIYLQSIKGKYTTANITECLTHIDNSIFILVGSGNPTYKEYAQQYQSYTPAIEVQTIKKSKIFATIRGTKKKSSNR